MDSWLPVVTGLIGAGIAALPLVKRIKDLNIDNIKAKQKLGVQEQINTEAEWKRILQERADVEIRLRARDDEQDKKIDKLMDRIIEGERTKAAMEERLKIYGEHVEKLSELLLNRCPTCPSRPNLMDLPSVSLPGRLAGRTETSAASPSPAGN